MIGPRLRTVRDQEGSAFRSFLALAEELNSPPYLCYQNKVGKATPIFLALCGGEFRFGELYPKVKDGRGGDGSDYCQGKSRWSVLGFSADSPAGLQCPILKDCVLAQ